MVLVIILASIVGPQGGMCGGSELKGSGSTAC